MRLLIAPLMVGAVTLGPLLAVYVTAAGCQQLAALIRPLI